MKNRIFTPLLAATMVAACGGDTAETMDPAATTVVSADEQALAAVAEYWTTHYNMGHPGMVASVYAEDAWFLAANGHMAQGPEQIEAYLGENAAASPQIEVAPGDQMVFGDHGLGWGTYTMSMTPEGSEPVSYGGSYMTHSVKVDGEWKIQGHLGNLTDDPIEGFEFTTPEGEPGPDEGTMGDLVDGFTTHYNLGHPSMVADYYTEDAMASFSSGGPIQGRAAIADALAELMEANPSRIEIHEISTTDLGDGWAMDGGWYSQSPPDGSDPVQVGGWMNLLRQQDDGSWLIHWAVANGFPPADGM